jgi:hypothetical protein
MEMLHVSSSINTRSNSFDIDQSVKDIKTRVKEGKGKSDSPPLSHLYCF